MSGLETEDFSVGVFFTAQITNPTFAKFLHSMSNEYEYADLHYADMMSKCVCEPHCHFEDSKIVSRSFFKMNEERRINLVQGMLLSTSSRSGSINYLKNPVNMHKRLRTQAKENEGIRCTVQYAFQGRLLCSKAFSALVQLNECTVRKHAHDVANSIHVEYYSMRRNESRKDVLQLKQ